MCDVVLCKAEDSQWSYCNGVILSAEIFRVLHLHLPVKLYEPYVSVSFTVCRLSPIDCLPRLILLSVASNTRRKHIAETGRDYFMKRLLIHKLIMFTFDSSFQR